MARQKASKQRNVTKNATWNRARYVPRRKVCHFCADKTEVIDFKDADKLRGYVSDRGKIEPRRRSGACAKHQRVLTVAIKRARHLALIPYVTAHMRRTERATTND